MFLYYSIFCYLHHFCSAYSIFIVISLSFYFLHFLFYHVRDFFQVTALATLDTTDSGKPDTTEYIMGFINVDKSEPIFFSVAYKHPDVTVANNACFINYRKLHSGEYNSKIVMGDFNINLLLKSNDTTYLRDVTGELALKVVNHGPTHHRTTPDTWINAIFVDCSDTITDTENKPARYHNHHNLIGVTPLDIYIPKLTCESFTYREFNKINNIE